MEKPFSDHFLLTPPPPLKLDSSFFPFPFPTFHQVDDVDIVFGGSTDQYSTTPSTQEGASSSIKKISGRRKRSLRKDRHSKIRTAQGLRDRRMRLSLDVAPDFFEIQDMLGFDKASKTLRWLITAAKPAIQELFSSASSEAESGDDSKGESPADNNIVNPKAKRVSRRPPPSRRAAATTIARESRIKARERARERTEEKKSLLFQSSSSSSFDHHHLLLCNSSSLGVDHELVADQRQRLVTIFDYNQSSMFPVDGTGNLFHDQQWYMEDMQLQTCRLWEA